MRRIPGIRPLVHTGRSRRSIARDVDDELQFHVDLRIEDLMRDGHSREDATTIARREYGDLAAARAELTSIDRRVARRLAWREWLSSFVQDARFAARGLRARPGFTLTVAATLALGIGANAAIFSVVDAVLLRPLPFAEPAALVHLWETYESHVENRSEASYPDYLDWRSRNRVFSDLGGYTGGSVLVGGERATVLRRGLTTANFFDVLGVRAARGRTFLPGEDAVGAPAVVVLSDGLWRREFAADPGIIGRQISLNGSSATVIGVLPRDFRFARMASAQLWTPIDRDARVRERRGSHWLNVVARLRPGVTVDQASQDMSRIMRELGRQYPGSNAGRDGQVVPLRQEFLGSIRPIVLLVYAAVVVVLLIACVNVANLLLIRGADRRREIAVRIALGAGRARLVRQLVTESLLLALAGGALGIGVAALGTRALAGLVPARPLRGLPDLTGISLDWTIVAYAVAISVVAGFAFGVLPALRVIRPAAHDALRDSARSVIGGASRLRDSLVAGEIALTVLLLSGAVLFGRSLVELLAIDPGFRPERVTAGSVVFPSASHQSPASRAAAFDRLLAGLRATPGVVSAGLVTKLPLDFGNSLGFTIVGQAPPAPGREPNASYRQIDPGYFRTMGIPLVRGREFDARDDRGPWTLVVNRAFVKAYFIGVEPVGQGLLIGTDTMRIAGVVGDVPIGGIEDRIPPTIYVPFARLPQVGASVVIRTNLSSEVAARVVQAAVAAVDPSAAATGIAAMTDVIEESPSVFMRRFPLYLLGAFALTALALSVVGIYGVVSYSVAQRTREMGIRMALGAAPRSIVGLVLRQGVWIALIGVVIGVVGAVSLGRLAGSMLYGVRPTDATTYLMVGGVLTGVALTATLLPARRATRVDPSLALRSE